MRLDLYYEQTGPSQAAGGSAHGLTAYLEGVSFRGIDRIWRVSHGMVIQWVRRWGKGIGAMRKEAKPEDVAMDELCPYVAMVGRGGCG